MRKIGLIALMLILCIGGAAFAQGAMPVFCGDLSQTDCAILTKSQDAMKALDSVSFDLKVDVNATNIPSMTAPMAISLTGNGSFSGMSALQGDMTAMMGDPGKMITTALDKLDGDMTFTLNLPPELMKQAGGTMPSTITLQIRLVDGIGYLNTDTLAPLMGSSASSVKGWYGLDLANLLKTAMQQMPDMFNSMMSQSSSSMAMAQQFSNPDMLKKFVSIKRTDDGSGSTATFETTVDMSALMSSPEFQDMMTKQMQASGQTMTAAQMQQGMAMSEAMMQGMTITVDTEIGTDDGFVRSIHGSFALDTSGMMASMSSMMATQEVAAATTQAAPNVNVDFTLSYSNFNSAPKISAPEGAVVIPYQSLLGMAGGAMGGAGTAPMATAEPTVSG